MTNKITVVGSLNVDTTLRIKRMPLPGETLSSESKSSAAGGKGANQAVAAARAGADTKFVGRVGNDQAGQFMIDSLSENHIDTRYITKDEHAGTGSATILLDDNGQNSILVYGGANQCVSPADVDNAQAAIANADFVIAQFETPQETTLEAFKLAKQHGVKTILNPAPAAKIDPEILKVTDLIIPNETECATLTNVIIADETSMLEAAGHFAQMGVKNLIITVGSKGAFYCTQNGYDFVPAFKVHAVDTTAAGDTFIGALSSQLKPDMSNIKEALIFAQRASSITVQRMGALPSIPTLAEIEAASQN
ncbi:MULTISPECIES: ribokinase [Limosilactobacillus]|uniref:Ribokinase n=1 Tax=Limosilactobacillus mucosae TaxID=97478 RepID=A0A099YDD6_LIMMU|nr:MULTISPECIES: ribokinase [Limosilactobacillus]KGL67426.1 ribokinase [Limosilactobacillus mucosae]MCC6096724.1 ribokinase [Limosilactobacillus sp.]MCF0119306.1 ribokinase [Limosilactobacillus mucosae]MCI6053051.1 ribokinase [Limosilactobacillus mucosae]QLI94762.1 ribokinase [Limosilactobacillus mucosae]